MAEMLNFFKKLMFANQVLFTEGRFMAIGVPIVVYNASLLTNIQKHIIKELGQKGIKEIYSASKSGGQKLTEKYLHIAISKELMNDFLFKMTSIGGWGVYEVIEKDWDKAHAVYRVMGSSFAAANGKSSTPVCHMARGLIAGAMETVTKQKVDCIETKCIACGHPYCEFRTDLEGTFDKKDKLVKEQLGG